MDTSLPTLISKYEEKLVDQAATSLKVMFGVGYADLAQEELEERLYRLFDALVEITRRGAPDPTLIGEVVDSVMVTPVYDGWNNRAITEEVLQVIDMVINKIITTQLTKPEQAEDLRNSQELLALTIRNAKDVVNGRARRYLEEKQRKQSRWSITGNESEETVAEVAAS
jgi:hypothetical protein